MKGNNRVKTCVQIIQKIHDFERSARWRQRSETDDVWKVNRRFIVEFRGNGVANFQLLRHFATKEKWSKI